MDDKNGKSQNGKSQAVPISALVALCAALGVIIYNQVPLTGIRPSVPEIHERSQKISARLWQDPFQAVLDQAKAKDAKSSGICNIKNLLWWDIQQLQSEIKEHLQKIESVTVLGVMVSGTPYDEEIRLRHRYAVVSGLHSSGFIPEDPGHVSFISIFQSQKECKQKESQISLSTILPYEWFVSKNHRNLVLILWINDDVFQEKPLAKLAFLVGSLQFQINNPKFKVIGPAGSTTLHEMLKELQAAVDLQDIFFFVVGMMDNTTTGNLDLDTCDIYPDLYAIMEADIYSQLNGLEIYSAKATADDSFLLGGDVPEGISICQGDPIAGKFKDLGITFQRTICSDRELAQVLVKELWNRGVDEDDSIALITEWDTLYGRSFPETFKNALKYEYKEGNHSSYLGSLVKTCKRLLTGTVEGGVDCFSYLRTLDGKVPGEVDGTAKKKQQINGGTRKEEKDLPELEKPMGRSQYDYLRRLTEYISELDQQPGRGKIKAFGVLGSDFYDKYLVLQALWQRFPERIFFTTDLDARLLHPASIKYTRNLVVASGFGLQLHEKFQGDVPPFRDVYQTSIFLATRRAFRDFHPSHQRPHQTDRLLQQTDPPNPRLFEIGKHHAIDLTEENETEKTTDPVNDPKTVQPPRLMPKLPAIHTFLIILISSLSFLLLWLLSKHVRQLAKGMRQLFTKHPEILFLALAVLIFFYYSILKSPSEEPFSLTEGVSIWPTNILRLIAIALSWYFIFTSIGKLKNSDQELCKEFRLGEAYEADTQQSSQGVNLQTWWRTRIPKYREISGWFKKCLSPISAFNQKRKEISLYQEIRCDEEQNNSQSRVSVNQAWEEYVCDGQLGFRLKPVFPLVFLYVAICFLVIILSEWPTTPARGVWSRGLNHVILLIMIFSFLTLTFFVFYTTGLCRRFVTQFLKKEPQWNPESLDQFQGKVGLEDSELSEWMLIQLIAKRTEVVGNLIYYPFIVWFIIFLSRLYYFDNYHAPIGLAIVIFMCALLAWACAFMLRRARQKSYEQIFLSVLPLELMELISMRNGSKICRRRSSQ